MYYHGTMHQIPAVRQDVGVTMQQHETMHQMPAVRQDVGVTMQQHGTMHRRLPHVSQLSAGQVLQAQYCYDSTTPMDNPAPEMKQVVGDGETHYVAGGAPVVHQHQLSKNKGMR